MSKPNLFGLSLTRLQELLSKLGEPAYRAKQIQEWLYHKRVARVEDMTNLSKSLRLKLAEHAELKPLGQFERFESCDGSVKYLFELEDGKKVEAVYMQMTKGITLCLSSQVGCAQACDFCMTARMGFIRNLSAGEIFGQAFAIMCDQGFEAPFNVVMMGMGEPLLNLHNLLESLDLFIAPSGLGLSPRRITVSTSGHVRNLLKLGEYPRLPRIAVSLNATTDEQRNELMPVNLKWNIAELLEACAQLPIPPRERITIEYVLLRDINDTPADARRLVRLLAKLRCKVNLIPFNETPELPYRQPEEPRIHEFQAILERSAIRNTVRWSKGRDVGAACGQLVTPIGKKGAAIRSGADQI